MPQGRPANVRLMILRSEIRQIRRLLVSCWQSKDEIAGPLRFVTIQALAFLASLKNLYQRAIHGQKLPITGFVAEATLALNHYGQQLRPGVVYLCEFFADNDRTRGED